ncbi:DUF1676 domain-containing protein Osi10b isoform 2-T2 [Cochliomyia hominivorax]
MLKIVLKLFVIFTLNCSLSVAIISSRDNLFSARKMGQSIAQCFGKNELINCLENEILQTLDRAIANNETWQLSDFLFIEKKPSSISSHNKEDSDELANIMKGHSDERSLSDTLALKFLKLAQTRSLKLQLPSSVNEMLFNKRSISTALDDFNADAYGSGNENEVAEEQHQHQQEQQQLLEQEEGTLRKLNGLVDDKISKIKTSRKKPIKKFKPSYSSPLDFALTALPTPTRLIKTKNKHAKNKYKHKYKKPFKNKYKKNKIYYSLFNIKSPKGRKKKDKDKNMAMIGGMAMLAMVAQMFLGKVILIAGAAFVMAKVALLISVLGSLKKGTSGSGGGTDHVIVTGGGGGGSSSHSHEHSSADEHKFTEPVTYYEVSDHDEFKRRNQQQHQQPPIHTPNKLNKVKF